MQTPDTRVLKHKTDIYVCTVVIYNQKQAKAQVMNLQKKKTSKERYRTDGSKCAVAGLSTVYRGRLRPAEDFDSRSTVGPNWNCLYSSMPHNNRSTAIRLTTIGLQQYVSQQ